MKTWWMGGLMANVKTLHLTNLFSLTWTHQPVLLICIYQLSFLLFLDVSILSQCLQAVSFRVKLAHWIEKAETSMMAKRIQHISEKKQYFIDCLYLTVMRINIEIIKIFLNEHSSLFWKIALLSCHLRAVFMCLMHGEAKQTDTSECGAEKGLLLGRAKNAGGSRWKDPNSPTVIKEGQIWRGGLPSVWPSSDWLVGR